MESSAHGFQEGPGWGKGQPATSGLRWGRSDLGATGLGNKLTPWLEEARAPARAGP